MLSLGILISVDLKEITDEKASFRNHRFVNAVTDCFNQRGAGTAEQMGEAAALSTNAQFIGLVNARQYGAGN
jgi:hypothetical protein